MAALLLSTAPASVAAGGRQARIAAVLYGQPDAPTPSRAEAAKAARAAIRILLCGRVTAAGLYAAAETAAGTGLRKADIAAITIDAIARHMRAQRLGRQITLASKGNGHV